MTALTFGQTPEEDDVYEIYFVLKNAAEVRSAKPISIATEGFKANNLVNSGVTKSRRSLPAGTARRANGAMTFSFTPKETVSGGESIILELPHYSIDVEGPVFGITSSHAAFETYAARNDWEVYGVRMDKARAVFTNGYVASGVSALKRSQENSGLDGFFMLATKDDGIEENKNNWFTETTLWEGTLRYEDTALAPTRYTAADADRGKYSIYSTTSWKGAQTTANPNTNIAVDDLVGMRLTCSAAITQSYTPDVFGSTHYVTESSYILENSAGGYMIVVESMFSAARFSTHSTEDTVLNAQCRIEYKPTVAKYTGMTVMFDQGKEFTMKQGAGALYQVTDGSGEPPSAHDIEGRAYTIYSQLEITAAQGETVAAGETVTITIDASAGISAPADLTAPVVASQADGGKCTHNIVPNTGSVVSTTANNDLDVADTMTVVRKCNYAGMPSGDFSIAAKSTIRRVFASALGRSSSNEVSSTARLSQLPPYKYDASETGPHLLGKPMDVYGATSLLATTMLATAEDKPGVTLSTALDMTTRTDWTREATYAGKAFVIGQENSGMAAPLDISATQRVLAVADATQISVGDYLNVGDEMMLVETVDGNYIGVVRGAAGTTAASHKSLGPSTADDDDKQYLTEGAAANGAGDRTAGSVDAVPAHGWVTIWKRKTKSVFVNAATEAKADITPNVAPNFGTANANLGDSDKGYLLLAGGTSSKEFLGDAAPDNAVIDIDASSTAASSAKPYFATNANAYEKGDSLVLHSCDWDDNIAATAWQTMSGVSGRDNKCKQTTLLGLPVIPVLDATGIQPKDYLRVNFPKDIDNDLIVDRTEEELYRVNAVINNDVVVTHNPLALATGDAANVNRYAGGTNLDLLSYKKTITYSAVDGGSGGILANANSFTFTASSTQGVLAGYYCLIDSEFMKITSVSGSTVTIGAAGNPAAGLTTGNGGRQAFGTGVPGTGTTHGATGSCLVYELKNGNGQATEATRSGFGHTQIFDPRVSIRAVKSVQSTTSLHLEAKAGDLSKTASEPANIIGDPYEEFENANPVRSGTDYRCPTVGAKVHNHAGTKVNINKANVGGVAYSATDTVFILEPAYSTSPWDLDVGDYIKVGANNDQVDFMRIVSRDTTASTITVDRTVDFMPSQSAECLTSTQGNLQNDDEIFYVQHNCATFDDPLQFANDPKAQLAAAVTATTGTASLEFTVDAWWYFSIGSYYKLGAEIFLVKGIDYVNNKLTVERGVSVPCRSSTATTHLDDANGFRPVIMPNVVKNCKDAGVIAQVPLKNAAGTAMTVAAKASQDAGAMPVAGDTVLMVGTTNAGTFDAATNVILGTGAVGSSANGVVPGDFIRVAIAGKNFEYMLVTAVDEAADKLTVTREVYPFGKASTVCAPGTITDSAFADGGDVGKAIFKLVYNHGELKPHGVAAASQSTDGEDYQIDSGRLKASSKVYVAGALGDMLEDVNRADTAANPSPVVGKDGGKGTTFFASPWGQGGNVTEFCYAAGGRSTTVTTDGGSGTLVVASLDDLGVVVGDYIQVTAAGTVVTPGAGEYMKVTAITESTKTLTVIRNVAPNCLGLTNYNPVTASPGAKVTLMKPDYDVVQLVDSVTKQAAQAGGADGSTRSSGSCGVVSPMMIAHTTTATVSGAATTFQVDDVAATGYGLTVGSYLKAETSNNYFLVTGMAKVTGTANTFDVTAVRQAYPPCVGAETAANTVVDKDLFLVATGGCYAMSAAADTTLNNGGTAVSTTATSFIATANTGMQVGGYLFIDAEYMLITDIDGTTITVVRNVAPPPCVIGTTTLTSTLATHATNANVFILSLSGSNNMISTSMRAIVELSPREPIVWAAAAPVVPPSPHYVDLRVTMPYSLAEFNVPSVTEPFKRAIARVAGTTVDKIVLSFPEQRRAATDTLLVDVRINADSAAEVRAILATLGADPDTLECASTCRAALLVRLNKELRAEGLREALAIEIRGSSVAATKKKEDDNLLLLLLLLLLIPIGAAVYWCCKQEPVAPVGLPQPYPVLEMSPQPVMMAPMPVMMAPMPVVEMSPQPVMMAPMPMVEMSPQPVMMAPMGVQPPMPVPAQPMQYGM